MNNNWITQHYFADEEFDVRTTWDRFNINWAQTNVADNCNLLKHSYRGTTRTCSILDAHIKWYWYRYAKAIVHLKKKLRTGIRSKFSGFISCAKGMIQTYFSSIVCISRDNLSTSIWCSFFRPSILAIKNWNSYMGYVWNAL